MQAITDLAVQAASAGITADIIIKAAAVLSALLVIWGAAVKIIKPINKLVKKLDKLEKQNTENYLCCLRLTIMSEEMPLEERIAAGDKYVKAGGNGAVKHKYHQLIGLLDGGAINYVGQA